MRKFNASVGPIDHFIGKRIRKLRVAAGLSQDDLAAAIKVKFQQLQKYEGAKNRVSAARLVQIADALDASVLEFLPEKYR